MNSWCSRSYNIINLVWLIYSIIMTTTTTTSSSTAEAMAVDANTCNSNSNNNNTRRIKRVVVATRIHLGWSNLSQPPTDIQSKVTSFANYCTKSFNHNNNDNDGQGGGESGERRTQLAAGVIAVDSEPKIDGYDLVDDVRNERDKVLLQQLQQLEEEDAQQQSKSSSPKPNKLKLDVLPVTPWGKFVPALNALIAYSTATTATTATATTAPADYIVFCSAETTCSRSSMDILFSHMTDLDDDTLVVGAVLPGHDYRGSGSGSEVKKESSSSSSGTCVELDGRTCPWNTLSVWNMKKLALTGFQLVSDGILTDAKTDPSYGVEEVVAVCLLQKLLGEDNAKAKLVQLPDVRWDHEFDNDPERQRWQEQKMKSKLSRAGRQLELTGLSGKVYHY